MNNKSTLIVVSFLFLLVIQTVYAEEKILKEYTIIPETESVDIEVRLNSDNSLDYSQTIEFYQDLKNFDIAKDEMTNTIQLPKDHEIGPDLNVTDLIIKKSFTRVIALEKYNTKIFIN